MYLISGRIGRAVTNPDDRHSYSGELGTNAKTMWNRIVAWTLLRRSSRLEKGRCSGGYSVDKSDHSGPIGESGQDSLDPKC